VLNFDRRTYPISAAYCHVHCHMHHASMYMALRFQLIIPCQHNTKIQPRLQCRPGSKHHTQHRTDTAHEIVQICRRTARDVRSALLCLSYRLYKIGSQRQKPRGRSHATTNRSALEQPQQDWFRKNPHAGHAPCRSSKGFWLWFSASIRGLAGPDN